MILVLGDDRMITPFASKEEVERRLEAIDVANGEFRFCDDAGQRYIGVMVRPVGRFDPGAFELRPEGRPEATNALDFVDQAVGLEPNKWYKDLASLRDHLARAS